MGVDISSGSVTDCLLRLFSNLKGHTQQCRIALLRKSKQTEPEPMSSLWKHTLRSLIQRGALIRGEAGIFLQI